MTQLLLDIRPKALPTLTNFVPGRNHELLHTLRKMLFLQEKERFLYVWGKSGCGKSHLLQAVVEYFMRKQYTAYYYPGEFDLAFQQNDTLRCVAVDDVERLDADAQIKLFNIYNELRDHGRALLLVSGSSAPAQLDLRQDLVTRLGWGLVYQIHEITEEEKIEALQQQANERGFELQETICRYLLRHSQRDLPSLIVILDALDRYSLTHKRQITIPLLKKLLQGMS